MPCGRVGKDKDCTDGAEVTTQIKRSESQIVKFRAHLDPLRSGAPLVSPTELLSIPTGYASVPNGPFDGRYFASWAYSFSSFYFFGRADDRRVVSFLALPDPLSPHDKQLRLAEDLGIEHDTPEHLELECGPLCVASKRG